MEDKFAFMNSDTAELLLFAWLESQYTRPVKFLQVRNGIFQ
jgi:hypothetical protein